MFGRRHGCGLPCGFMGFLCPRPITGLASDILIHGMKARNRSIHGDVVVVELLPKNEWKGRTTALCENDSDDKASGDPPSEPMPTGEPTGWSPSYPFFLRNIYRSRDSAVTMVQYSFFPPPVPVSPLCRFILLSSASKYAVLSLRTEQNQKSSRVPIPSSYRPFLCFSLWQDSVKLSEILCSLCFLFTRSLPKPLPSGAPTPPKTLTSGQGHQ